MPFSFANLKQDWQRWLAVAVVSAVVLAVGLSGSRAFDRLVRYPHRAGLYAVFLTNGQVYFGTVAKEDESHLLLQGIYYLQWNGKAQDLANDQSDAALLKLGNELHGPEDWMDVNRSQVLFIERLKPDGKVAKAIDAYVKKP